MKRLPVLTTLMALAFLIAASAPAQIVPNRAFEQGAAAADEYARQQQYQRYQPELQRRQFENERLLEWERTAQTRVPSRNHGPDSAVGECANGARLRAYSWDLPDGTPRIEWFGPENAVRVFRDCLASRGYR
jgi:hypothetical protein